MKIKLLVDTKCARDEYEMKNYPRPWYKEKPKLPKGTVLTIRETWRNFFGSNFRCEHEGELYDIPTHKATIIKMTYEKDS